MNQHEYSGYDGILLLFDQELLKLNLLLRGGCCTLRWAGETDERPQIPDLPKGSEIGTTPQPGNSALVAIGEAADHQLHGPEP